MTKLRKKSDDMIPKQTTMTGGGEKRGERGGKDESFAPQFDGRKGGGIFEPSTPRMPSKEEKFPYHYLWGQNPALSTLQGW